MMSVLFCSARLRALELSDYKGNTPAWVEACMHLCLVASITQLASVVATGVISGDLTEGTPKHALSIFEVSDVCQIKSRLSWTWPAVFCQYVSMGCLACGITAVTGGLFFATPASFT